MPIMVCETAQRLDALQRAAVAKSITESVHDVIGSDLNLISVVLHELGQDQICRTAIAGRSDPLLHSRRPPCRAEDRVGAPRLCRVAQSDGNAGGRDRGRRDRGSGCTDSQGWQASPRAAPRHFKRGCLIHGTLYEKIAVVPATEETFWTLKSALFRRLTAHLTATSPVARRAPLCPGFGGATAV
jgi:phenylpyruvate tautomerase PptA (4-oxalocrotonate tautomerase family)